MASFMNTMFVNRPFFPQSFPCNPKPLPALHSNVLVESHSAVHLPVPYSLQTAHESHLQYHIRKAFCDDCRDRPSDYAPSSPALPTPPHFTRDILRFDGVKAIDEPRSSSRGLSAGLWNIEHQTDLLTRSNSSARSRNTAAFQPTKRARGTNSWQLKQFAEATLGSGSLRKVVQLPEGENREEWLAVNLVDFYNQINLLYGAITEFCSPASCPEMKATDEFEYLWHDPPTYPKPTRLPAPTYISLLLTWSSTQLSNPAVFPTQPGVPFPESFDKTVRVLFKRLYRIYAHIYCHHYSVVRGLGLEAHLNTGFKHYVLFVEEFGLADEKGGKKGEWFGPLGELVESMLRSD